MAAPFRAGQSNTFPQGQCTYWADERYRQLAGYYVPWSGNAWQWSGLAPSYGWTVSNVPVSPAIICLQPGVQGAGPLGHVGVVESISGNSIETSNLNWGSTPTQVVNVTHTAGQGVSFIHASSGGIVNIASVDPHDICTACGKKGSPAYQACLNQIAISHTIPTCAQSAYNAAVQKAAANVPIIGPAAALAQHIQDLLNDPTRLAKGFVGIVLLVVGLVLLVKQLVPVSVQKAALAAVGA